jgi:DNA (cytosine-5)-methyltransferase 1
VTAWYNEPDPYAAQWLRNLIAAGHIADGVVDERPIQEIEAYELVNFTQCHFFAGIGIWSLALRQAGWSDDKPIWTGSCPCQPFSNAGKKKGFSDDRHLWPVWQRLVEQRCPSVIVGEQVESAPEWIDLVSVDLEKQGYAFGAAIIPSAGFSGAHIRHRAYFVGLADLPSDGCTKARQNISEKRSDGIIRDGADSRLADDDDDDDTRSQGQRLRGDSANQRIVGQASLVGRLVNANGTQCIRPIKESENQAWHETRLRVPSNRYGQTGTQSTDTPLFGWPDTDWLFCRDGKWRPVESGTFPLAHEDSDRVGRLRAYGNALDAETATNFCEVIKEICIEIGI